jgi:hypothetical protein
MRAKRTVAFDMHRNTIHRFVQSSEHVRNAWIGEEEERQAKLDMRTVKAGHEQQQEADFDTRDDDCTNRGLEHIMDPTLRLQKQRQVGTIRRAILRAASAQTPTLHLDANGVASVARQLSASHARDALEMGLQDMKDAMQIYYPWPTQPLRPLLDRTIAPSNVAVASSSTKKRGLVKRQHGSTFPNERLSLYPLFSRRKKMRLCDDKGVRCHDDDDDEYLPVQLVG